MGAGGLGRLAVQILRALTPATVIAVDTRESALSLAAQAGAASTVLAGDAAVAAVIDATNGAKAELVLDFVGAASTVALGAAVGRVGAGLIGVCAAPGAFRRPSHAPPSPRHPT